MTNAPDAVDQRQVPEADRAPFARLVVVGSSVGDVDELTTKDELQAHTIASQNLAAGPEADQQRLEAILQGPPIGMSDMDGSDHIYRLSSMGALDQLGWTEDEVPGRGATEVQLELVSQGYVGVLDRVFRSGQRFTGRDVPIRHDRSQDGVLQDCYSGVVYHQLLNPAGEVEASSLSPST